MADRNIDIELAPDGWGEGNPADIRRVLRSASRQFMRGPTDLAWPNIHVFYNPGHPITHRALRQDGRVEIGLNTSDRLWSQYSYQFAHEMVHFIAGHLPVAIRWQTVENATGWVEESICEAGSLFALRSMSMEWKTRPPYPNWKDYSSALWNYAQERMDNQDHCIPEGMSFPEWLAQNVEALRGDPYNRKLNTIVAKQMLSVFEAKPLTWNAVAYLRTSQAGPDAQLDEHLLGWINGCPQELRQYVQRITAALR
jgi:hypothetical protein